MTNDDHDETLENIQANARAEMDALEAQLPTLQRALVPWAVRVLVLAIAVYAVIQWRGTDMTLFLPLVAIYAAVSFALTYYAYVSQRKAFAKRRATLEENIGKALRDSEDDT